MKSKIEWTEESWNPTTGCTKISPGCTNCYAETMALRLRGMGVKGYENGFELTMHEDRLKKPLQKKKPTIFFVNSMSDLFHEKVPYHFIDNIMDIIKLTPFHHYQILTKRPKIMADYFKNKKIPANVWLGVTVENKYNGIPRMNYLRELDANIRFISAEPLLEDLGRLNLKGIDWVIVGGESGNRARPMKAEWALNIKEECRKQKVPFFFKQWGTWGADGVKRNKKSNGRVLEGKLYNDMPKTIEKIITGKSDKQEVLFPFH